MNPQNTAISLALLGAIFGLALCHSHPNTAVKITTISLFSAIGVVVGSLVTPLFNADTANICNLQKLLRILTQNNATNATNATNDNNANSYIVPQLNLSGDHVDIQLTSTYVQQVLCPIVSEIQQAVVSTTTTIFIGIVGGSGSGKTTLSQLLVRSLAGLNIPSVTISMDNYHYTNQYLDNTLHSYRTNEQGFPIKLRKVKGRSETINSKSMLDDLKRVAAMHTIETKETQLLLPVYDRALHDPVSNRLVVPNTTRVVLVEGLHLLRDEKSKEESKSTEEYWIEIRNMFTSLYYLRFDDYETQKERVMQRRIRGGISREWASPRYDQIDAVVGNEIEKECKRAMKNRNEKSIVVLSLCEDENGKVQLERKEVYDGGLKVV